MNTFISRIVLSVLTLALVGTTFAAPAAEAANYSYTSSQNWGPKTTTYTISYPGNSAFGLSHNPHVATVYSPQYAQITYLLQLIAQLEAQLKALQGGNYHGGSSSSEIEITTLAATDIDGEDARLRGEIDFDSSDYAYVWFEWGKSSSRLNNETAQIRIDEDDSSTFSARITDLDEDDTYYFRAAGEDEDGDVDYGSVRSFRADDDRYNDDDDDDDDTYEDAPEAETGDVTNVTHNSARIHGEVDMNDFEDGIVFFLYGEDEDQINDAADDYDTYSDIDTDGDDLQKVRVDTDLDGSASYNASVYGLTDDTEHFYTICVQYEDEDDDDQIICGDIEEFETDN